MQMTEPGARLSSSPDLAITSSIWLSFATITITTSALRPTSAGEAQMLTP